MSERPASEFRVIADKVLGEQARFFDELLNTADKEPITFATMQANEPNKPLLIVQCGLGVDSIALLILLEESGIRPDAILFANVGVEWQATYDYIPRLRRWLAAVNFSDLTVVRAKRNRDSSLEAHCLRLGIFPSISYRKRHACSVAWKIEPCDAYLAQWLPFQLAVKENRRIVRAVGFEFGEQYRVERGRKTIERSRRNPHDRESNFATTNSDEGDSGEAMELVTRTKGERVAVPAEENNKKCNNNGISFGIEDGVFSAWFPLIQKKLTRADCVTLIERAGLPVPHKSSCTFCAAMKKRERVELEKQEPHKFFRHLVLEKLVQDNEIVPHPIIRGLDFGGAWLEMDIARKYTGAVENAIRIFDLKRTEADGRKNSDAWKPKRDRVELFLAAFENATQLESFLLTGKVAEQYLPTAPETFRAESEKQPQLFELAP